MIFYFSGTGNSRWVAQELARLLGDTIVSIPEARDMYFDDKAPQAVWVFPIYSWGVPPVVRKYIKKLIMTPGIPHYLVCTCGDDIGLAHMMWRRDIIKEECGEIRGMYSVRMPNSYTLMKGFDVDDLAIAEWKLTTAEERVKEIARRIASGDSSVDVVKGKYPWFKTKILYPLFKRFCMSPRPFHATDACVGCGKCACECPMKNIMMSDGKPAWGKNCAMCLRCYHTFPHHAVAYGKATEFKGQYLHPDVNQ